MLKERIMYVTGQILGRAKGTLLWLFILRLSVDRVVRRLGIRVTKFCEGANRYARWKSRHHGHHGRRFHQVLLHQGARHQLHC